MPELTDNEMREQFEAWAVTQGHSMTLADGQKHFFNHHGSGATQLWEAWQAAYRLCQESLRNDATRRAMKRRCPGLEDE